MLWLKKEIHHKDHKAVKAANKEHKIKFFIKKFILCSLW